MIASTTKTDDRWAVLAGLRFALAVVVLVTHIEQHNIVPKPWYILAEFNSFVAVIVFLIISGYSIGHSYSVEPKHFYERRMIRIYPLFFISVIMGLVPFIIWGPVVNTDTSSYEAPSTVWSVLGNFAFLNRPFAERLTTDGTIWSLSVEVFFYAITPLLARLRTRYIIGLIAVSAFCYLPFMASLRDGSGVFVLGCFWLAGFLYYRHQSATWAKNLVLALGVVLLTLYAENAQRLTMVTYVLGSLVIMNASAIPLTSLLRKVFIYGGEISYPLYILHYPLFVLMTGGGHAHPWWIYPPSAFALSVLLYHLVDRPYRRYATARLKRSATAVAQSSEPVSAGNRQ